MLATQPRLRSTRQGTDVGRGVGVGPIQVPVETCMYKKLFKKYVPGKKQIEKKTDEEQQNKL